MEDVLYGDPFRYHISKYLQPKDLYNIKCTNKAYNEIINKKIIMSSIKTIIFQRLTEYFGDLTTHFINLLQENNGIISGSFLVQCILNEYWDDTNINIYIPDKKGSEEFTAIENFIYNDLKWKWKNGTGYDRDIVSDKISFVRDYKNKKNQKLHIIHLDTDNNIDSLYNFVHDTFDFDIVKNIYSKDYLRICNLHDILTKQTKFKYAYRLGSTIKRYNKYKQRGFHFINMNDISYKNIASNSSILYDNNGETINSIEIIQLLETHENITSNIYNIISGKQHILEQICNLGHYIKLNGTNITISKNTQFGACTDDCCIKICGEDIEHKHYTTWCRYAGQRPDVILIFNH